MKQNVYINRKLVAVDISIGMKIGHSLYVLSSNDTPRDKNNIIELFMASTLEEAVRFATEHEFFKVNGWINLITGDGQVCRITQED